MSSLITLLIMFASATLFTLKHPLAMGLTMIFHSILVCILAHLYSQIPWFAFILFYIFMGAMMVLFIYISSLAPNEPFYSNLPLYIKIMAAIIIFKSLLMILSSDSLLAPLDNPQHPDWKSPMMLEKSKTVSTLYTPTIATMTSLVILFLLLTLIVVVKITLKGTAPLRTKNF